MKIGIISDIHSNIIALRAVTKRLAQLGCDAYFLLGDFISDTPYTRETMEFLYDFIDNNTCHVIRGNREEYMLNQRKSVERGADEDKWLWNSASGNLLYTYEELGEDDLKFFEDLPITFVYEATGLPAITCAHGSPENSRELLQFNNENTINWLMEINTDYLICAHTHFPGELNYKGKHYFNPGCVGISINDIGNAQCMIIESVNNESGAFWKPIFLKVPYDYKRVVEDIYKSGLYYKARWFVNSNVHTLLTGIDRSSEMVNLAKRLSKEFDGKSFWPNIDERFFEEASNTLGIPNYYK